MQNKRFQQYYLFACLGVLVLSCYPLKMGFSVVWDMLTKGTVMKEDYPKYVIPYTPVCLALLVGTLLMPIFFKWLRRFALLGGGAVSIATFFGAELLLEREVVVTSAQTVADLADWQMYMCAMVPGYRKESPISILMGDYNPAFKLHFYVIALVLVLIFLNCLYGFGWIVRTGEKRRKNALLLQSVAAFLFLGLCILACFTAFWRDGNLLVSPLSATLMGVFFVLLGVTVGIFAGSFFVGKRRKGAVWIPAVLSALMTLTMYIGEMILLNGHLYQYGTGFFFRELPGIVLAPVDIGIVLLSGLISGGIFHFLNRSGKA